jgi:cytochrome c biogenesis protein CcmG, thiol:disulfide interchange protein DsbE
MGLRNLKNKLQLIFLAIVMVIHSNLLLMGNDDFVGKIVSRDLHVEKWLTEKPETQGKFILIDFWRTWCGPCFASMPGLNKIQKSFADDLVIVGITSESESEVRKVFKLMDVQYSLGIEPKEIREKEFKIESFPHGVLIDPSGVVRWYGNPLDSNPEFNARFVRKIIDSYKGQDNRSIRFENQAGEEVPPLYVKGKSGGIWSTFVTIVIVGAVILILAGMIFELSQFIPDGYRDHLIGGILGVIVLVFLFHFYDRTGRSLYAYLSPLCVGPYFLIRAVNKSKQEYKKRHAEPSAANMWICAKCGEETHKIIQECVHCGQKKP